MARYILHRLVLLPLLMVFLLLIFAIVQAPPGDFLTAYVATLASSGSSLNRPSNRGTAQRGMGSISPSRCNTYGGCSTWFTAISACRSSISGRIST